MKNIIRIEDIRARQSSANLIPDAQARVSALQKRLAHRKDEIDQLTMRAQQAGSMEDRLLGLRKLIRVIEEEMQGIAPCKSGCSSCCHIPVMLTEVEAEIISRQVDAPMRAATVYSAEPDMSRVGVACGFLENDQCSIYENRPIACRLHFSMDIDALLCTLIPGEQIDGVFFDGLQIESFWLYLLGGPGNARVAELHQFFDLKK